MLKVRRYLLCQDEYKYVDDWLEEEGKEEIEVILLKKSDYLELINKDKKNV